MFVWCIRTSGTLHAPGQHRAAPLKCRVAGCAIKMQAAMAYYPHKATQRSQGICAPPKAIGVIPCSRKLETERPFSIWSIAIELFVRKQPWWHDEQLE